MSSRKEGKQKIAPHSSDNRSLTLETRDRMARLVGHIEHEAQPTEKQRYQAACIREAHLTHCLRKARTAQQARRILWLFSTNMTVDAILAYLKLPYVTCPARTCFSLECPRDTCPATFEYDSKRLSIIFKTGQDFINTLTLNPSRAKIMLAAALEISQQVLLEVAIRRRK